MRARPPAPDAADLAALVPPGLLFLAFVAMAGLAPWSGALAGPVALLLLAAIEFRLQRPPPAEPAVQADPAGVAVEIPLQDAIGPMTVAATVVFAGVMGGVGGHLLRAWTGLFDLPLPLGGLAVGVGLAITTVPRIGHRTLRLTLDAATRTLTLAGGGRRSRSLAVAELTRIVPTDEGVAIHHTAGVEGLVLARLSPEHRAEVAERLDEAARTLGADPDGAALKDRARKALQPVREGEGR